MLLKNSEGEVILDQGKIKTKKFDHKNSSIKM